MKIVIFIVYLVVTLLCVSESLMVQSIIVVEDCKERCYLCCGRRERGQEKDQWPSTTLEVCPLALTSSRKSYFLKFPQYLQLKDQLFNPQVYGRHSVCVYIKFSFPFFLWHTEDIKCLTVTLHLTFWDKVSHWAGSFLLWLSWLVNKLLHLFVLSPYLECWGYRHLRLREAFYTLCDLGFSACTENALIH